MILVCNQEDVAGMGSVGSNCCVVDSLAIFDSDTEGKLKDSI